LRRSLAGKGFIVVKKHADKNTGPNAAGAASPEVVKKNCTTYSDSNSEMQASVAFLITQKQKRQLKDLGYGDEEIFEMTPERAHSILGNDAAATDQMERPTPSN
jgi:hypothetical protein